MRIKHPAPGEGPRPCGVLTLTTDFGNVDGYVGTMKGVALCVDPSLQLVDLVHTVRPQSVLEAAFHLRVAWQYFPPGTVHLAVVDPGVGTMRGSVVAVCGNQMFVAPDNGLLPAVFSVPSAPYAPEYWRLNEAQFLGKNASRTFHGRDLYAPAAARLATGAMRPSRAGRIMSHEELVTVDGARVVFGNSWATGVVLHTDHFGNVISNFDVADPAIAALWSRATGVEIDGQVAPIVGTYGDGLPGQLVALLDSFGLVEVAVVGGNAAAHLGVDTGAPVVLIAAQ